MAELEKPGTITSSTSFSLWNPRFLLYQTGTRFSAPYWQSPWSTLPCHLRSFHSSTLPIIPTKLIPTSGPLHLLFPLPRTSLLLYVCKTIPLYHSGAT